MDRRSLLRSAPVALGVATGALLLPTAARADSNDDTYIAGVADILGVTLEEAEAMWADKEFRRYLPVSFTQTTSGGRGVAAQSSKSGDVAPMANIRFAASHTFKNMWGNILMKVTMQKTTVDNSNPVRGVGAFCTPSTTTLGKTAWVSEGPNPSYDIDTAVGTGHRSRRGATWSARGAQGGKVTLAINMTVRVGEYLDVSRQTI